jgi:hypothetical protein
MCESKGGIDDVGTDCAVHVCIYMHRVSGLLGVHTHLMPCTCEAKHQQRQPMHPMRRKRTHIEGGGVVGSIVSTASIWLDRATIQFRFFGHCQTCTGSFCVFGPVLSSPAHGT